MSHSATPPWLEQVPEWCFDFEYVPSLHFAVAPVGSVLPAVAVGADFDTVADLAAAGAAAAGAAAVVDAGAVAAGGADTGTVAGVAAAAALLLGAFCTPPWPLHAPRPVAAEVVPSLQVLPPPDAVGAAGVDGAEAAAGAGADAGTVAGVAAAAALFFGAFCTPP